MKQKNLMVKKRKTVKTLRELIYLSGMKTAKVVERRNKEREEYSYEVRKMFCSHLFLREKVLIDVL